MQVLIFGAGGQLGTDLVLECEKRNYCIHAFTRKQLDINNSDAVQDVISTYRPDCVINAAAYNSIDRAHEEPVTVLHSNSFALTTLAKACMKAGAVLLHYSTDHVFDGEKGSPYTEEDKPSPCSLYGASKLAGEMFVQLSCEAHYVLRVAGVYGPAGQHTEQGNFLERILRRAQQELPLEIVDDSFVSPTYGPALATRSLDILEKNIPYGLYHLGGGEGISWHEFAMKFFEVMGNSSPLLPVKFQDYKASALRLRYSVLLNAKIERAGIAPMPELKQCLSEYVYLRQQGYPPARVL